MSDPRLKQLKLKAGVVNKAAKILKYFVYTLFIICCFQAGIVRRCTKDVTCYEKEAEKERFKIEKLKAEGKDSHDIKKQEEVLAETLMMIPDSKRRYVYYFMVIHHTLISLVTQSFLFYIFFNRLKKCWEELNSILQNEKELKETTEYQEAHNVWLEAKKAFESESDD